MRGTIFLTALRSESSISSVHCWYDGRYDVWSVPPASVHVYPLPRRSNTAISPSPIRSLWTVFHRQCMYRSIFFSCLMPTPVGSIWS